MPAQPRSTACRVSSMESVMEQQPVPGIMRLVGRPSSTSRSSSCRFSATDRELASELVPNTARPTRSEEHTSELQSLMRNSYAVFCLKKKKEKKLILSYHDI